jgi:hypothetical protein
MITPFDSRIDNTPWEWRGPLVDTMDTAEAVRLRLKEWGMENDAHALVGFTALVLQEHRRQLEIETEDETE